MKVLGISGSLRSDSHNTALLRAAAELLPGDVELELWDGLKAVPPYDEDDDVEPAPAAVADLRDAIAGADAILFATPEYNQLAARAAQERARLGLPAARDEPAPEQAGGGRRREHGRLRRRLGAGRAPQGAGARPARVWSTPSVAVGHAHERFDAGRAPRRRGRCASSSTEVVEALVARHAGQGARRRLTFRHGRRRLRTRRLRSR